MSFCPRCGAPTTVSMAFCTKCGETLQHAAPPMASAPPPSYVPSPTYAPYAGVPQAAPPGPAGSVREPWVVVILAVVTLGIYPLFYWWNTSKQMDDYLGKPDHSHKPVKIGVLLTLGAMVVGIFVFVGFFTAMFNAGAFDTTTTEPDAATLGTMFGFLGGFLVVLALGLSGSILLYVGRYRMWEGVEAEERRRGWPGPLSAGLMLALSIAAYVVPFVGFVLPLVVLYMTQEHLNKLWAPLTPWAGQAAR